MEIKCIKIKGCNVISIYVGEKYYFINDFYGILAIAVRRTEEEDYETGKSTFDIRIGNNRTIGTQMCPGNIISAIKRSITTSENQFITKKITYHEVEADLSKVWLTIEEHGYTTLKNN